MENLHFLRPGLLWLLLIPLSAVLIMILHSRQTDHTSDIPEEIRKVLIRRSGGYPGWLNRAFYITGLILLVLSAAGPAWQRITEGELPEPDISIAAVMNVTDSTPEQDMLRMKLYVYRLVDSLDREKMSLVLQGGSSHIIVPYTDDHRLLKEYAGLVSPDIMPVPGDDTSQLPYVAAAPSGSGCHAVIYITPDTSSVRSDTFYSMEMDADSRYMVDPDKSAGIPSLLSGIREKAGEKQEAAVLGDSTVWQDEGWWTGIVSALFFLPLFLRFRKGLSAVCIPILLMMQSCTYTGKMYDRLQTGIALAKGDTLKALTVSDDSFVRGCLMAELGDFEGAAEEFSEDTSRISRYNLALSLFYSGRCTESLSLFRALEKEFPDWTQVRENRVVIESWLNTVQSDVTAQREWITEESTADEFEKDSSDDPSDLALMWADLLSVEEMEGLRVSASQSHPEKGEVLYRQAENRPEEFLKRRLKNECR